MEKIIIGIAGYARSGKDTLAKQLAEHFSSQGSSSKIFSLAWNLKNDIDDFCKSKFGISSFCEISDQKSKIRPILIAYGNCQRDISKGKYWIEKLKPEIDLFFEQGGDVAIIPDIRFKQYDFDEYDFIRSYKNNFLFTVSLQKKDGSYVEPAHETEKENFPFFLRNSDYNLSWLASSDQFYLKSKTRECLEKIFNKL